MCGISGMFCFDKPTFPQKKALRDILEQAMYVGSVRGRDSTGIWVTDRDNGQMTYVKQAVDGAIFGDRYNVNKLFDSIEDYSSVVIHNRKATMGVRNDAGAHPFNVNDITLVHNGTLWSHRLIGGGNQFGVDSEAITYALTKQSKITTLEELDGAFTLVWHDNRDQTLNIARNTERPLYVGFAKNFNAMVFCSEKGMLEWLCGRNKLELKEIQCPSANTLYSWDLTELDSVSKFAETKFEGYSPYREGDYAGSYGNNYNYHNRQYGSGKSRNVSSSNSVVHGTATTRAQREATLEKYGMKVGDTIEFVSYDVQEGTYGVDKPIVKGLDKGNAFETIAFMVDAKTYTYEQMKNALFTGRIQTVRDTSGFPHWLTIVVTDLVMVDEDHYDIKHTLTAASEQARRSLQADNDATLHLPAPAHKVNAGTAEDVLEVVGPGERMVSRTEWNELTKNGCSNCSCTLLYPNDTFWTHSDEPICDDCIDEVSQVISAGYFH